MPGRATLLALLTGQTLFFTAVGLALWTLSGRPARSFVTFGQNEFLIGALPKVAEYLIRAQAENFAFLEKPMPFPAIVWISLGAGIGEEALFRAGVQTLAADYVGAPLAIALGAALFAVVHFAKPAVAAIILVIGVLFGCVYWITGSLLAVMIGHALYDVFALWYVQKEMHRLRVFGQDEKSTSSTE